MYEIYTSANNQTLFVENLQKSEVKNLKDMPQSWINSFDKAVREDYPETWEKLGIRFGRTDLTTLARVAQFAACNFAEKNGVADIDENFNFHIEQVFCPARMLGICKLEICSPKLTQEISKQEINVLKLFCEGMSEEEISDKLFIAPSTVHNHINNMYKKTGISGQSNPDRRLMAYARTKGLID